MHVSSPTSTSTPLRPLLKWAGGKRQLLAAISTHYPAAFSRYIEPFLGSGAVFFDLVNAGRLQGRQVRLADVNADLIGCYRALRDRTEDLIRHLQALERTYRRAGDGYYYEVRDAHFNPLRAARAERGAANAAYPPALAAMFIFLNRTGFNGLFRLNRRGEFNVPVGRYADPRICDAAHLRTVAEALRAPGVTLELRAFDASLAEAGEGDFVYCDPPYAPLSRTASFASYTADGFNAFDQKRLQQAVIAACARGARVVLSNSSAPEIVTVYSTREARAAGLRIRRVPARRAINSRASARGPVDELIITNVPAALEQVQPRMLQARPRQKRKTA